MGGRFAFYFNMLLGRWTRVISVPICHRSMLATSCFLSSSTQTGTDAVFNVLSPNHTALADDYDVQLDHENQSISL